MSALEQIDRADAPAQIAPPPGVRGHTPVDAVKTFREGTSSMMFNIYAWNRDLNTYGMDVYDVAVVPRSPSGQQFTTAVPNVWVINKASPPGEKRGRMGVDQVSDRRRGAKDPDGGGRGRCPSTAGVAFDFANLPDPPLNRGIYLDSYAFAETLEENAVWAEYTSAIERALEPLWAAEVTAREAAERAHRASAGDLGAGDVTHVDPTARSLPLPILLSSSLS